MVGRKVRRKDGKVCAKREKGKIDKGHREALCGRRLRKLGKKRREKRRVKKRWKDET